MALDMAHIRVIMEGETFPYHYHKEQEEFINEDDLVIIDLETEYDEPSSSETQSPASVPHDISTFIVSEDNKQFEGKKKKKRSRFLSRISGFFRKAFCFGCISSQTV